MTRRTVVVAVARDPVEAGHWVSELQGRGIEAASFERGVGAALGGAETGRLARYPVIVAEEDLAHARSVISEVAGASVLAPVREAGELQSRRVRLMLTFAGVIIVVLVGLMVVDAMR
jgi:hypothetical protein